MNKVAIVGGKAIIYDDRWVTIGGEDEDGSGQHVLIKENGNIVAGFGKGKNVKNAFSEKRNEAAKPSDSEEPKKGVSAKEERAKIKSDFYKTRSELLEKVKNGELTHEKALQMLKEKHGEQVKRLPELQKRAHKEKNAPNDIGIKNGEHKQAILSEMREMRQVSEMGDKISEQMDAENEKNGVKHYTDYRPDTMRLIGVKKTGNNSAEVTVEVEFTDNGIGPKNKPVTKTMTIPRENIYGAKELEIYEIDEPKEVKPFTKKYQFNSPDEAEANRKAKNEIFRQAAEASKKSQAEKDKKERSEARATLKRAEAGLAEAKAKGDVKAQSFWEAARNRAEKILSPSEQYKLDMERAENRRNAAARRKEAEKLSPSEQYKRDMERAERRREASARRNTESLSRLKSQHEAIALRERGYNNQIAELEKKNPTERNKARLEKLKSERDEMTKRKNDVLKQIESHPDYEKPTSAQPKKMVKVEPNKVTISKQSNSANPKTAKPKEPKSANIKGGRRLEYDDDVVKIYRNGKLEYHGIEDDSPYHRDDNWKWNASKGYYEIDHPTGKYVMVVPK